MKRFAFFMILGSPDCRSDCIQIIFLFALQQGRPTMQEEYEQKQKIDYMDCHTHLLDYPQQQIGEVIQNALREGVRHIVVNTTTSKQFEGLTKLTQVYEKVILSGFGIHPCFVDEQEAINKKEEGYQWMNELESILKKKELYSVGEIGLDFRKDVLQKSPKELQMVYFKSQLNLAIKMNRPATIHCVRAHGQMLKIFKDLNKGLKQQNKPHLIMHSYGGSEQITKSMLKLENLNIFFSLSLKRSESLCSVIPVEKLVCQTDSPCQNNIALLEQQKSIHLNTYLHRMSKKPSDIILQKQDTNQPVNVIASLKSLIKYYNMDEHKFVKTVYNNCLRAFKLIK